MTSYNAWLAGYCSQLGLKGVVRDFGHRTPFPREPVCYLSLKTVFNAFHSVLLVAEIACARLAQVEGNC